MKRKRWQSDILLWIGIALCICPLLIGCYSQKKTQSVLATYEQVVDQTKKEELVRLRKQAEKYNEKLWKQSEGLWSQDGEEEQEEYQSLINPEGKENGVMGVVEIPSISVRLPIYHGTEEEVLKEGAGHLTGSSLPIGGKNTHCVLTGHRGLASARLFTRLDELRQGDKFFLEVLGEKLVYQVEKIQVIRPEETKCLEIRAQEDLVSLVTCTPYGINTHRLVITGKRLPQKEQKEKEEKKKIPSVRELLFTGIPLVYFVSVCAGKIKRKREKRNCEGKKKRRIRYYYQKRMRKRNKKAKRKLSKT